MLTGAGRPGRRPLALLPTLLVVTGLGATPLAVGGDAYLLLRLTPVLVLGVLAVSANLAWGYTGIFTLGHALFFGIGAYAAGLIATKEGQTSLFLLLALGLAAGLIGGLVLAAFLFAGSRVGPLYVGLVTLALAYVTQQLAGGWNAVGAANGLAGLPLPTIGSATVGTGGGLYYCALMLLSGAFALRLLLTRSQFGLVMTAVRDDEERAEYFGYRRTVVQGVVLTVSAWLAHDRRRPRPENTSRRRAGTRSGRSRARPSDHT